MKRFFYFLFLFLFLQTFLYGEKYVNIGLNAPLTGPYAFIGIDEIRAARMAVVEINSSGGILGRKIKLHITDSASDPYLSVINVRNLILKDNCKMIFGGVSSAVALVASDICYKFNRLFFGTLTYSTSVTWERAKITTFRECYNSWMAAKALGKWLNIHFKGKKFAYITADYTWGWTTENSIRKVTGTQDRSKNPGFYVQLGASDYYKPLKKILKIKPDVLVLVLFGSDLSYALKQAQKLKLKEKMQIVVPNLAIGLAELSGAIPMEGVVGALPWMWKVPFKYHYKKGIEFVKKFSKIYNRYPSTAGASAYTILYEYKAAVERAKSFNTEKVIKQLEGHRYKLLKDVQYWRKFDHQSIQTVYVVKGNPIDKVLKDKFHMDYFDILYSVKGDELAISKNEWIKIRKKYGLPPYLVPVRLNKSDK